MNYSIQQTSNLVDIKVLENLAIKQ